LQIQKLLSDVTKKKNILAREVISPSIALTRSGHGNTNLPIGIAKHN
jgi:hypothetical protein